MKNLVLKNGNSDTVPWSKVFGDFFGDQFLSHLKSDYRRPAVNIEKTDSAYLLEVALPGFSKKDIEISVEQDILHIKAEKKQEKKDYFHGEFSNASCARSFQLPQEVVVEKIEAEMKDGILFLNVPLEDKVKQLRTVSIK